MAHKKSSVAASEAVGLATERPFLRQIGPVIFLALIFLLNFISRVIFSPLLPTIEKELAISHGQAGFFFFLISAGYLSGLLGSGFLSSRSTHRLTILFPARASASRCFRWPYRVAYGRMRSGLFALGLAAGFICPRRLRRSRRWSISATGAKPSRCMSWRPTWRFSPGRLLPSCFFADASWRAALALSASLSMAITLAYFRLAKAAVSRGVARIERLWRARAHAGVLDHAGAVRLGRQLHRGQSTRCCRSILSASAHVDAELGQYRYGVFAFLWADIRRARRLGLGPARAETDDGGQFDRSPAY